MVYCGHKFSIEDFLRAREAKDGQLEAYNVSENVASNGSDEKAESPSINSPVTVSPLSQRRGARLQRKASRAQGETVEKADSSEDELDFNEIEFGILQGDSAEVHIDETQRIEADELRFSRVSSTESVTTKKEMKKRKKKKRGPHPGEDFERVASADSQVSKASSSRSLKGAALRVSAALAFQRRPSFERKSSGGPENAPRELTGHMKIAALEKDMIVEKIEAADASIQLSYDDESLQKTYELDLDGADEVEDVVQVLKDFAKSEQSSKYITLLLGRTGFGSKLQMVKPHIQLMSTITSLALNTSVSHSAYLNSLAEQQSAGFDISMVFESLLAPPPMTCLTELNLSNNFLRAEGTAQLKPILLYNSLLTALDLSSNDIFCKGLPPVVQALSTVCTHLRALSLTANWIACDGVAALAPVFEANTDLQALDLSQNGIAADGCLHLSNCLQTDSMSKLVELRIDQNRIDEQAQKYLFPAFTTSSSLGSLSGMEGGTLGTFYEYIIGKIAAVQLHIPTPSSDFVRALDLSNASLNTFPIVLLELKSLETLDISNNFLHQLPYIELCALSKLKKLECRGNVSLMYPSADVLEEGGVKVMTYLREALKGGCFNISVLLIPVGEVESGKTCLIRALEAEDQKCPATSYCPTVAPDLSIWTPEGQTDVLDIRVVDTSGNSVYSVTHEFFTAQSSLFLFVWRLEQLRNRDEDEVKSALDKMVYRWLSKLHFSTPGATVLAVATHVDAVESHDVRDQDEWVQKCIKRHVHNLGQMHPANKLLYILNDARSMHVGSLKGFGIRGLSSMIVSESKRLWLWGHPLSEQFRALAGDLHTEKSRSHAVELSWKEFKVMAINAGFECDETLRKVLVLLHDLYYIRYWGDLDKAWHATDAELEGDGLLNTVYIDVEWCAGVFRGLIRHERDALHKYFGGRIKGHAGKKDKGLFNLSKRILVEGILHQGLMPYMWPEEYKSRDYWMLIRAGALGKIEQNLWPEAQGNIANSAEDYKQIENLLVRFGVMTRVSVDEFFVPYMKANSHRRTIDGRAVAYNDCPYLHKFAYKGTPEHFFWRLSVSLTATFKDNQIGLNFSAHYNRGTKVFLSFSEGHEHVLTVRSTHRREVELIKHNISVLEAKYPGLRRVKRANMDKDQIVSLELDQAVQVFISHSSDGNGYVESEDIRCARLCLYLSHSHLRAEKEVRFFAPTLIIPCPHRTSQNCSLNFLVLMATFIVCN